MMPHLFVTNDNSPSAFRRLASTINGQLLVSGLWWLVFPTGLDMHAEAASGVGHR